MPVYQNSKTRKWKFRVYANDIFGKRKQFERKGFNTKKEAIEAERRFLLLDNKDNRSITFEELWNHYYNHISLKLKPQSLRAIKSRFNNHILPYFKDYKIDRIDHTVYVKWQREIEKKGYRHKYNSSLHTAVSTILSYGMKFYGLKENTARLTGNFTKKYELKKEVDYWSYEDYKKFIDVVDDKVYKIFFELLYFTGLRQGEALALTWNDISNNKIIVNKTIAKEKLNGKHIINTPKTSKSNRKVKITEDLIKDLQDLKTYYKTFIGFEKEWFMFGGINPLAPTTVGRKKNNYCKIANIKKIRIHDFRHSHASLLLSKNVPITVVSERLGHSDIKITLDTYAHMLPDDEHRAIEVLNKLK